MLKHLLHGGASPPASILSIFGVEQLDPSWLIVAFLETPDIHDTFQPLLTPLLLTQRNLRRLSLVFLVFLRKSSDVKPFVTKDKSLIREFFHPLHETSKEALRKIPFSIALATLKPRKKTLRHIHETSAEFYYVTRGVGIIQLNSKKEPIEENTLIYIPTRTKHTVTNTGKEDLLILCICSPPYSHEDTKIVE